MPKRDRDEPQQTVKLAAIVDSADAGRNAMLKRDKRFVAGSQSPSWHRYAESRLRQFVSRQ